MNNFVAAAIFKPGPSTGFISKCLLISVAVPLPHPILEPMNVEREYFQWVNESLAGLEDKTTGPAKLRLGSRLEAMGYRRGQPRRIAQSTRGDLQALRDYLRGRQSVCP